MNPKLVWIVARPDPLGNSLCSLLASLDEIDLMAECIELSAFMGMDSRIRPDLILVEPNLTDSQLGRTFHHIKQAWPHSRTILLVDRASQRHAAQKAGADVVLFKGCRAATLVDHIKTLLSPNRDTCAAVDSANVNFALAGNDQ
jgi:DNA-binding NarL/FixJ family response regulator